MSIVVQVCTPCRLHFGMFSFGHAGRAQFGGVGVMVEPPNVQVDISVSDRFEVRGALSGRVVQFVNDLVIHSKLRAKPRCIIDVQAPPDHAGLGVGTQLGLAVAAGLHRFLDLPDLPIESLAASIGRGGRSAVGTYGFARGGLIIDGGKRHGEGLGELFQRVEVPLDWRFVLVRHSLGHGLSGTQEANAFAALPPVPNEISRELWRVVTEQMIPAVKSADCAAFGEAVYVFGRLAGECFATAQGGAFATPAIEQLVNAIHDFGVAGVGQSSWGPTVFAVVPTEDEAEHLTKWLRDHPVADGCEIEVARPNNSGARISGQARIF